MNKTYDTKVNDAYEFTFDAEEITALDTLKTGENTYHAIHDNKSYKIIIQEQDFLKKKYTVNLNGTDYKVGISDDLDKLIKELGFEVGAGAKVNEIFSPMPGLIFDIMVNEGDEVTEDQPLLILEAMKMENVISAPREGKIKKIAVQKGQAIEKKALLIEFE